MRSLVDHNQHNPSLSVIHPFVNVQIQNHDYFSSTNNIFYSWTVDMHSGSVNRYDFDGTDEGYLWPVRGGNDNQVSDYNE